MRRLPPPRAQPDLCRRGQLRRASEPAKHAPTAPLQPFPTPGAQAAGSARRSRRLKARKRAGIASPGPALLSAFVAAQQSRPANRAALFFTTNRPYRNSYYGDFSRNTRNSISLSFLRAVRSGPAPSLSVRTALLGKWPSLASQKFAHDQFFAQIENISRNALILCT